MVVVVPGPAQLDINVLSVYYTKDALLANLPVVIFYGPSTTTNSTLNSSRIQAHVLTLAGFQSFPRLTVSPTAPLYAAVHHLPKEKQGDEICRGLAVSLLKFFAEMPKSLKVELTEMAAMGRPDGTVPAMFDEMHAGDLAAKMIKIDNPLEVITYVRSALAEKSLSWTDIDVILPPKSITIMSEIEDPLDRFLYAENDQPTIDYGKYEPLVRLLGSPTFLPTSKLRRAPSKPTAISRSRTLAEDQKESLHREMYELLDTEERYVAKLYDLVHRVAVAFCRKVAPQPDQINTPSDKAMRKLFPECLNQILDANSAFVQAIRTLLRERQAEGILDSQSIADPTGRSSSPFKPRPRDMISILSFANLMLEWIPRFREPYQAYLRASSEFSKILNILLRDSTSRYSQQIHATGEQRLRSWLIEPVQRLPRYSLFIDNMVNQLPATHPAMGRFLKAKDMLTDICALDDNLPPNQSIATARLRDLVQDWPASMNLGGRLITAVDASELQSPYSTTVTEKEINSTLMLFPCCFVVVRKSSSISLSARGLMAEIDRSPDVSVAASPTVAAEVSPPQQGLTFAFSASLQDTRFTESNNGTMISMACISRSGIAKIRQHIVNGSCDATTKVFRLSGAYEGKAARWSEEVARARIEQRFPEIVRENDRWGLLSLSPSFGNIGFLAAIFENDYPDEQNSKTIHGRIQIAVDQQRQQRQTSAGDQRDATTEIMITITLRESNRFQLDFSGLGGHVSTDDVSHEEFIAVFVKRMEIFQRLHNQPYTAKHAQAHIAFHQKVVGSLPLHAPIEENHTRRFRPRSPVKALSNFLGSVSREPDSPTKSGLVGPLLKDNPIILLPQQLLPSNSSYLRTNEHNRLTLVNANGVDSKDSLAHLEATFLSFVTALRVRSGNVIGKVLRGRIAADELKVNELYNILVADPSRIQAAAEVSIDVLFAAFEKFLDKAWKDRMGPVLSAHALNCIQSTLDSYSSSEVADQFKGFLSNLTPQNRRAFSAMIKLLSDLLEASSNDADRGALIATFAEALVVEGNPHDYITLLDRLVEDFDVLFEDATPSDSVQRTRSINTGSLSSNASSFRKRFGFTTLSRENSKTESESRVGQVWRTLSNKKIANENEAQAQAQSRSQPSSLSKSFLSRSRSTDNGSQNQSPARPVSRDQLFASSPEARSRPGSAHNTLTNLITIGEVGPENFNAVPRRKRRSSLSDLLSMQNSDTSPFGSPAQYAGHMPNASIEPFQVARMSLRTPSPTKIHRYRGSPQDSSPQYGLNNHKENSPSIPRPTLIERAVNRKSDEVLITNFSPKKRLESQTGIPTLKKGLYERPVPINSENTSPTKSGAASPQKLRIQSPQKLRERLQLEKKAIQEAGPSLQAELTKIGEELSAINLSRNSPRPAPTEPNSLKNRIKMLETRSATVLGDLAKHASSIQADLESSLVVSERKCKSLDELYREANAENEALYERFNEELGKILKVVKDGQGLNEMREKLKEAQDDVARLKRENQRLRRENLGLKSQLKGE